MEKSKAPYVDFDREEIADAFATALRTRISADPRLRDPDAIGVHRKTLSKWERGEDLPGFTTACGVLHYIDGWGPFLDALEGSDRDLAAAIDTAISSLDHALRLITTHPSVRERRRADGKLDDLHDRIGRLRRALKQRASDEDETDDRRVPRRIA